MESHAKYALVGIGMVLLTVSCVVAILWLGGGKSDAEIMRYTIYFKDQSLDGLQVNSDVTMKGIKVGSVENFHIAHSNIEKVKATIKVNRDTPVKTDTSAVIKRNLLTGLASIDLVGSSAKSPMLIEVAEDEDYSVIKEGVSELKAIADSFPGLLDNVSDTVSRINALFSNENRAVVSEILANVSKLTSSVAGKDKEIASLIEDTSKLVRDMRKISDSIASATEGDRFEKMGEDIRQTLTELNSAAQNLAQQIDSIGVSIKGALDSFVIDMGNLVGGVTQVTKTVSTTAERLDDPRNAIFGPPTEALGPGERNLLPKEKR